MENCAGQENDIKIYIRKNWEQYETLHFDKLKEATAAMIQWPENKNELKKMQFWFQNEKKKFKKKHGGSASVVDKVEQAQKIFVKEEGYILQALVKFKVTDARVDFLKQQVDTNFMVMYDLLKTIQSPPYDIFLEELFDICSDLGNLHSQVLLFIRICALYSDEYIDVDQDLVKRTLIELSTRTEDSHAAYGLLKLAYQNEISFDRLPMNALLAFEEKYILDVSAFIRSLHGKIDFQIAQSLPDTCLIFTQPFFSMLRSGGKLLHEGIQPGYLVHLVELISFSFETQLPLVENFVQLFKQGCLTICGWGYDLQPLLQRVVQEEIAQNKLFFGSLKNQIKLFEQLFHLIQENKISKLLDEQTISELIDCDQSVYKLKRKQYKDMSSNNSDSFEKYVGLFNKLNKTSNTIEAPSQKVIDIVQKVFEYFNIPALNDIQTVALTLMEQNQKIFQIFGTGTGKTTLALAYMVKLAIIDKQNCFYVNDVPELCKRDFKRIVTIAQEMNIKAVMVHDEEDLQDINNSRVIFLSSKLYQKLTKHEELRLTLGDSALILDEFDLTLFDPDINKDKLSLFTTPSKLVAFTGSPLEKSHTNLINNYFGVVPLNYPGFEKISGVSSVCIQQEVFPTRKLQLDRLTEFCCKQMRTTPVLLIMEPEAVKSFQLQCKKYNAPTADFNEMNPDQIIAFLDSTFTQKINGAYSICILNATQGRGLDVPSCSAIETAGGVTTVIAQLPANAQEFAQFKGRTCRMGNKGQYCVILWAKTNLPGPLFIDYHLETVRNRELIRLNDLFQQQQAVSNQKQGKFLNEAKIREQGMVPEQLKESESSLSNVKEDTGKVEEKSDINMNDKEVGEKGCKGNQQKLQIDASSGFIERIKVIEEDGTGFHVELSEFNQFKLEKLENKQVALEIPEEVTTLKVSDKKRIQKQQNKKSPVKGGVIISVNIGKTTVKAASAFAKMSISENDKTPTKNSSIQSSDILDSLNKEGQKKKLALGSADAFGLQDVAQIGKRQTRQSQGNEEEGNKKQRLQ